jgi:hypothetical protein
MATAKKIRRNPTNIGFFENWNAKKNAFFHKGSLARSQPLGRYCIVIYVVEELGNQVKWLKENFC